MKRTPDTIAIVFEDAHITYQELNSRANELANHLRTLDVKPEVPVGLCLERSLELAVGIFGILKAGGICVPIEPTLPKERIGLIISDSNLSIILTQSQLQETFSDFNTHLICVGSDWEHITSAQQPNWNGSVTEENLAYLFYTSGTTGAPKGVMSTHRARLSRLLWLQSAIPLNGRGRHLLKTSIAFGPFLREFFWPLYHGDTVIMASPGGHRDPSYLTSLIARKQISFVSFVPSMLQAIINEPNFPSCNTLTHILCGGEPLPAELPALLFTLLQTDFHMFYGAAEASTALHWYRTLNETPRSVSLGKQTDMQVNMLDTNLQPVSPEMLGELYIAGDGLVRGYLNRPELTAEKFVPNPFSALPGGRMYKTGDLAQCLPDGYIHFVGRRDHQVKIRGFRVELGGIEAVLREDERVREAVVEVLEQETGEKRLVAYVVPALETTLSVSQLARVVKQKLPEYMVPSAFVLLEALPLTSNGKVNRQALPVPDLTHSGLTVPNIAPRTPAEQELAGIWAEILNLNRVGIEDNFFDLGGHSLLATQVVSRVREVFHVELPLRAIFERPTVGGLTKVIETARRAARGITAPPLVPYSRAGDLPLSFAQQRLWFLHQLEPDSPAYNIPLALRLSGNVDVPALRQSLQALVDRHETFRTCFPDVAGRPSQVIANTRSIPFPQRDLRELPEVKRETAAQELAREEALRPFVLATGPVIRATLLQLVDTEYVLLVTMHHIISDGWSRMILSRELAALYEAYVTNKPSPLPPLSIQYADFAQWQRQWLTGDVLEQQLTYWRKHLADLPPLGLPMDHPRPPIQTYTGAKHILELAKPLREKLQALSRQKGLTLAITLLAAFQVLLARYTGQTDIVLGSPIANRNRREIEGLIGFFVNTLVMRTNLSGDPSFHEVLSRVQEVALGAYDHQDLPFERLVEELQPERDLSRNPLFQVTFAVQNAPFEGFTFPGVRVSPFLLERTTTHFDLECHVWEQPEVLQVTWNYNTSLFDSETIERLGRHFQVVLAGIVNDPGLRLSQVPLLDEIERQQLLVDWNKTKSVYPTDACIHDLFEAQVERTPESVAVVFEDQQLTYQELNIRANQLAHYLKKHGVRPEVLVGLCLERSLEMMIGMLGILKAGGAYVPLDPTYPQERLAYIIKDACLSLLITQKPYLAGFPEHGVQVVCLDIEAELITKESKENSGSRMRAENLAYVIYTSGSTGQPKGVQIPHQAVVNFLTAMRQVPGVTGEDSLLAVTTLSFDIAVLELFLPLVVGARVTLVTRETASDGALLRESLTRSGTTVMQATPTTWRLFLADGWRGSDQLKTLCGGEALPRELASHLQAKCAALWNMYGPTETTIWSAVSQVGTGTGSVPLGSPIANTKFYVLDAQYNPVPIGVPGELHIGGIGLARGYLKRPELSAEKFIPDPFSKEPSARLYKTGDLVRYRQPCAIEFLGRLDHQVKLRGYRIELGEIEKVLSQHPSVQEIVVVMQEDVLEEKRLVAYVRLLQEAELSISELRSFLKTKLSGYMVPGVFVLLETFPLTPNGKVDRRALPAPEHFRPESEDGFEAAPSLLEEFLIEIWVEVLKLNRVGLHENFFELGGHSLLATQVISRIRRFLGVEVPLRALFETPTIAELARYIELFAMTDSTPQNIPSSDSENRIEGEI